MAVARRDLRVVDLGSPADIAALETTIATAISELDEGFVPEELMVFHVDLTGGGLVEALALDVSKTPYQDWESVTEAVVKAVDLSAYASVSALNAAITDLIEAQEADSRTLRDQKVIRLNVGDVPKDLILMLFTDGNPVVGD